MTSFEVQKLADAKYRELAWRLGFLRTFSAEPEPEPTPDQILTWYKQLPVQFNAQNEERIGLNGYFEELFPEQAKQHGPAVLEMVVNDNARPLTINHQFFAASLSDPALGLTVVYYEPEMMFYYFEPFQSIFKPVDNLKLQCLYRGLILRSASILKDVGSKLNIWTEFRSDKTAKAVTNLAKSVLSADQSYFSATSPHQRIKGQELQERLIRNLVETMLESRSEACLTVTQAYDVFCRLAQRRQLSPLKRSMFRATMQDLVRDRYGLALRNDVPNEENRHQQAWKGLAVVETEVLAA